MKCLSIRQPWASLVMLGLKPCENRSWPLRRLGRIAVHAAARLDVRSWSDVIDLDGPRMGVDEELDVYDPPMTLPALSALPLSAILGTVEVYDCVRLEDLPAGYDDAGFAGGPWVWLLREPRPLAVPFRCKGALSLWEPPSGVALA